MIKIGSGEGGMYAMTEEVAASALKTLSQVLEKNMARRLSC